VKTGETPSWVPLGATGTRDTEGLTLADKVVEGRRPPVPTRPVLREGPGREVTGMTRTVLVAYSVARGGMDAPAPVELSEPLPAGWTAEG
jgi:hypothetical protein